MIFIDFGAVSDLKKDHKKEPEKPSENQQAKKMPQVQRAPGKKERSAALPGSSKGGGVLRTPFTEEFSLVV